MVSRKNELETVSVSAVSEAPSLKAHHRRERFVDQTGGAVYIGSMDELERLLAERSAAQARGEAARREAVLQPKERVNGFIFKMRPRMFCKPGRRRPIRDSFTQNVEE